MWLVLTILALVALAALRNELQQHKTLQEKTTLQLRTQQEALFNSMVEGLLLLDQSGRIQLANRAFITLFALQTDVRGKTILEALRLHELAELVDLLAIGGQVLGHQMKLPGPGERWLQINGAAIFYGGDRHGTLLVFHDLTRLKRLERTREEFVANVSHELRTPLSLIKGYVETLLDGAKDNPEVAGKFLVNVDERQITCPGVVELCERTKRFDLLSRLARENNNPVHFLAGLIAEGKK